MQVPTRATRVKKDTTPTKRSIDAACSTSITPTCLKELYNVGSYTPSASSGSRVGFGSFLNQSAIYSDLFQYEEYFGIPHQNFSTILIAGATNDQDIATAQFGEANLDVSASIAQNTLQLGGSCLRRIWLTQFLGSKHHWCQPSPPSHGIHHWWIPSVYSQPR